MLVLFWFSNGRLTLKQYLKNTVSMKLCSLFLLIPLFSVAQFDLTVTIDNVKSADGKVSVALYNSADKFLKFDKVYKGESVPSQKGSTKVVIKNLPKGTCAIAAFHDENGNDKLDTNAFGFPKEPLGFSKGKMKTFGPPSFTECAFELTSNQSISVPIK